MKNRSRGEYDPGRSDGSGEDKLAKKDDGTLLRRQDMNAAAMKDAGKFKIRQIPFCMYII
jgi:hypothetical protein